MTKSSWTRGFVRRISKVPHPPRYILLCVCVCVCVCVRVLNRSTIATSLTFGFKLSNEEENSTLLSFSSHNIFVFLC